MPDPTPGVRPSESSRVETFSGAGGGIDRVRTGGIDVRTVATRPRRHRMPEPPDLTRRHFLAAAAATVAAGPPGLVALSRRVHAMTDVVTLGTPLTISEQTDPAIRPFRVNVPEE